MKKTKKTLKKVQTQTKKIFGKTSVIVLACVIGAVMSLFGYKYGVQYYTNAKTLEQITQTIDGARFGFLDSLYAEKTMVDGEFEPQIVSIRHVVSGVFFNESSYGTLYDIDTRREVESILTPANVPVWVRMERPGAFTVRMTGVSYDMCQELVRQDSGYSFAYVVDAGEATNKADLKEQFPSGDLLLSKNAVDRLCSRVDATRGFVAPVQAEAENPDSEVETVADKMALYPTLVFYFGVWDGACEREDAGTAVSCFEERDGLCLYKETNRPIGCGCTLDTDCDSACSTCEDNRCVVRSDAPETCARSVFLPNPEQKCQTATVLDMDGNETSECCAAAGYEWHGQECCMPNSPYAYGEAEDGLSVSQACCAAFAGTDDVRVQNGSCCLNGAEYDAEAGGFNRQTANCCTADGGDWFGDEYSGQCCAMGGPIAKYGDQKTLDPDCCMAAGGLYLSEETDKGFKGAPICCQGQKTWDFATGTFSITDQRCPIVCEAEETPYCVKEEAGTKNNNGMLTTTHAKCVEYACCPKDGVLVSDRNKPKQRQTSYCYVPGQNGRSDLKAADLTPYCASYDTVTGLCAAYSLCAQTPVMVTLADGHKIQVCPSCTDVSKQMFAPETSWNQICAIDTFVDRSTDNAPVLNIALPASNCCAQYKKRSDRNACYCLQKGGQVMSDGSCCMENATVPAMDSNIGRLASYCGTLSSTATVCGCGVGNNVTLEGDGVHKDMAPGTCGGPFPIAKSGLCCPYACNDPENGGTACCSQGSVNKYCCDWKCSQQYLDAGESCRWDEEAGICQYCYEGE